MPDPEWLKGKGVVSVTSRGINMDALTGSSPVPDRAVNDLTLKLFREAVLASKNEAEFQDVTMGFALHVGWHHRAHFRPARVVRKIDGEKKEVYETPIGYDGKGFFDVEIVRERLVKIEFKYGKNTPSTHQLSWLAAYAGAGVEAYIWYPQDVETIIEVLTRRTPCLRPKTG